MKEFFGLDIGSHSLKAVQLKRSDKEVSLLSFATLPSPLKSLSLEVEDDRNSLAEAIKNLVKEADISTKSVVCSLPEEKLFSRVVELPKMSRKEVASSLEYEAGRYIPIPMDEADLDFEIVSSGEKSIEVLLVAAPKKLTAAYLDVLNRAGLEALALEPETTACVRAVVGESADAPATLVVSIGASTTDLVIVEGGKIRFTRSVATGGTALGRAVAQTLGFEEGRAEAYKESYGLSEELEGKVKQALGPVFKVIVEEIRRSIDFYNSRRGENVLRRIILSGGTANLPGVVVYLASEFGLEVQKGNPWQNITIPEQFNKEELDAKGPALAVAIGLALRKFS